MRKKSLTTRRSLQELVNKVASDVGEEAVERRLGNPGSTAVMFLLDVSGSMAANEKLPQSKEGLLGFARDTGIERLGLIAFSDSASLVRTLDTAPLESAVASLSCRGGTSLAGAIRMARTELDEVEVGRRVMMLVTDGCPGDRDESETEAEAAKRAGIEILAIATQDADQAFLNRLVSSKEFSVSVNDSNLRLGIQKAAGLLALPSRR